MHAIVAGGDARCRALGLACAIALLGCAAPLRINDIQVVGTHNSYKQRMDANLLAMLAAEDAEVARQLDYGHLPLTEQLDLGVRTLELDVYLDPEGGRFVEPPVLSDLRAAGRAPAPYDPAGVMRAPGFKVMHGIDYDYRSSCSLLRDCLGQLRTWSIDHPHHVPIVVMIEPKIPDPDASNAPPPLPFDARAWAALDREIFAVLERERVIVPDDVRGSADTLEQAVLDERWPELEHARGKFLFLLGASPSLVASYDEGHRALRGRALFVDAAPGNPEAAIRVVNDPIENRAYIQDLVQRGYLVRTRADADTVEARSGDTRRRAAALASGAQLISTDYVVPDPAFRSGYRVRLPEGVARCNPVRAAPCAITE